MGSSTERTAVIATVGVLGVVPVATGLLGVIGGPARVPGGATDDPNATVTASLDSEYRFVNLFWLAAGILLWFTLRQPEKRADVTRALLGLAALGGLPRLLSLARTGAPHPVFRAATVLELVIVPLVIVWHRRVFPRR